MKLQGVDFMDSSGLGFFMGRYELCRTLGASFCLGDPPPRVMKILKLSGMDKKLSVARAYESQKKPGAGVGQSEKAGGGGGMEE